MAEDTKKNIVESAVSLFSQHGYHGASMTMIAEETGVSKGTLYWHFDSKEELFRFIVLKGLDFFNTEFNGINEKPQNAERKIKEIIKFAVEFLVENSKIANILRNNVEILNAEFQEEMESKHEQYVEIFTSIINQGIKEKTIRSKNPRNTAVMMLTVLFTSHADWLLDEFKDKEKEVEFVYDFIMNGIKERSSQNE